MADITFDNVATERRAANGIVPGKGDANSLKVLCTATVEIPATASGQTFKFGRIPANARISGQSAIYWDDLTTTGAPTFDLGLGSVDSNVTSDPDALTNGLDVTAAGSAAAIADIANYGLPAWDLVAGVTEDPKGELDVYGTVVDAATAGLTGTVTVELLGYLD
jgi:hypothetical protein